MLTMSGFHGTKHFVTRARKKRIMADYGGLWRIMVDLGGLCPDYGGLWRIMSLHPTRQIIAYIWTQPSEFKLICVSKRLYPS